MYVLIHGNVTVYEWKHGVPPENQNTGRKDEVEEAAQSERDDEIDWGADDDTAAASPAADPTTVQDQEIDFGIDYGEIDFGADDSVDISCITIEETGEIDEVVEPITLNVSG